MWGVQPEDTEDPYRMYLDELAKVEALPQDEEAKLFLQARDGDVPQREAAKKRLIENYLRLALPIADRYLSSGIPRLELIQYGNIGLFKAVDMFAENPTGDFVALAQASIETEIRKFIDDEIVDQ